MLRRRYVALQKRKARGEEVELELQGVCEQLHSCIRDTMIETIHCDFNANKLCLHMQDLTHFPPFIYERIIKTDSGGEERCVKVRLYKEEGKPVDLNTYLRQWRSFSDITMDFWTKLYGKKTMNQVTLDLTTDLTAKAKMYQFPAADPNELCWNFRNGSLIKVEEGMTFHEGGWPYISNFYFNSDFHEDNTVLPHFNSIFDKQGIEGEQRDFIMQQFGRLLTTQGNEWRCFIMLSGRTTNGKTTLLDMILSWFEDSMCWILDGDLPARWLGAYIENKHLLYFRDAERISTSLKNEQLLQLSGNEEYISEFKHQNVTTKFRARKSRILRLGNNGLQCSNETHAAIAQRTFCIDFPNTVTHKDPTLGEKLKEEAGMVAALCLRHFYAVWPATPIWHTTIWHQRALLKMVYCEESRLVQHTIVDGLESGLLMEGGVIACDTIDRMAIDFQRHSKHLCGPPIYKFYSVYNLGWTRENKPTNLFVEGDQLWGVHECR